MKYKRKIMYDQLCEEQILYIALCYKLPVLIYAKEFCRKQIKREEVCICNKMK
jgi:hypothetical protein